MDETGPDGYPLVPIDTRAEWHDWLELNAETSRGIWVVSWRTVTGRPAIAYEDLVEEALAFGWIDSTVRKLDEERTMLRLTPRRRGSVWSRPNKQRVQRLEAAGQMRPAGRAVIERAKRDGSWTILDAVEDLIVPEDLAAALAAVPDGPTAWEAVPPGRRKQLLYAVISAKRPPTREARIAAAIEEALARAHR